MLDTGFSISTIDPRLADSLKLRRIGKTTIAGIAGKNKPMCLKEWPSTLPGKLSPRRLAALPSERKKRSRRMEGILGAGFFRRFVVEIDPKAKVIRLHNRRITNTPVPVRSCRSNSEIRRRWSRLQSIFLASPQSAVDSKSTLVVMAACVWAMISSSAISCCKPSARSMAAAGPGRRDAETKVGSVPELQLGGLTVKKPEANFFQQGSPVEGNLAGHIGIEVLRQFRIIFDYSRQQIILEKN